MWRGLEIAAKTGPAAPVFLEKAAGSCGARSFFFQGSGEMTKVEALRQTFRNFPTGFFGRPAGK